ncbi:MAG: mechanosensitive ion channel domain-containing protein [Candidatus Electrothrix sp. GW3-4]|uniref:mechanosensitive ion channel domain-containing protein n=1 Tax=Candidatus Electrothrix sp. GW3-4 TaxID=3126740 RepID=UPI0030D2F51F
MNTLLSLQVLLSVLSLVSYFVIMAMIAPIIARYGARQRFLEKRIIYIKKFFVFLLFSVLFVVIALIWGFDIRGVLIFTSSFFAVVGVALFASWSVLSNITSGIIIFFSFPYRIGHKVKIIDGDSSVSGEIIDMTLFHIQIKDAEGNEVFYPNNLIIQKPVMKAKA